MEFKLEEMMSCEMLEKEYQKVLEKVDSKGKVVLLKDNKPMYVIIKIDDLNVMLSNTTELDSYKYTLHEAMQIVLKDAKGHTMHAADLADEIYKRGLYRQKNGAKAQYTQIRARCSHYQRLFEVLPQNTIKLRSEF